MMGRKDKTIQSVPRLSPLSYGKGVSGTYTDPVPIVRVGGGGGGGGAVSKRKRDTHTGEMERNSEKTIFDTCI